MINTEPVWAVEITKDGMWPTRWTWKVTLSGGKPYVLFLRHGTAMTKDRARREAMKAKRSIENDDVRVVYDR